MSIGLASDRQATLAFRVVVYVHDVCKNEVYFQGLLTRVSEYGHQDS